MIDFNFEHKGMLQKGSVLVSEPFLSDNYFQRSVIFMCDFGDEGSFGFVLNKYVKTDMSEIIDGFPDVNTRISIGGPVDTNNLFYIHGFGDLVPDSIPVTKGISLGGSFDTVINLLKENPENISKIRFFVGYSGWGKEQLEDELKQKSWIVLNNIPNKLIMDSGNENIWKEVMEKLGGKFKVMSGFPMNPMDN